MDFPLTVDDHATTLEEFAEHCSKPDVIGPTEEELEAIKNLAPGESTVCGIGGGGFIEVSRPDHTLELSEIIGGAADMLYESAKGHRLAGQPGHAAMCCLHASVLRAFLIHR